VDITVNVIFDFTQPQVSHVDLTPDIDPSYRDLASPSSVRAASHPILPVVCEVEVVSEPDSSVRVAVHSNHQVVCQGEVDEESCNQQSEYDADDMIGYAWERDCSEEDADSETDSSVHVASHSHLPVVCEDGVVSEPNSFVRVAAPASSGNSPGQLFTYSSSVYPLPLMPYLAYDIDTSIDMLAIPWLRGVTKHCPGDVDPANWGLVATCCADDVKDECDPCLFVVGSWSSVQVGSGVLEGLDRTLKGAHDSLESPMEGYFRRRPGDNANMLRPLRGTEVGSALRECPKIAHQSIYTSILAVNLCRPALFDPCTVIVLAFCVIEGINKGAMAVHMNLDDVLILMAMLKGALGRREFYEVPRGVSETWIQHVISSRDAAQNFLRDLRQGIEFQGLRFWNNHDTEVDWVADCWTFSDLVEYLFPPLVKATNLILQLKLFDSCDRRYFQWMRKQF